MVQVTNKDLEAFIKEHKEEGCVDLIEKALRAIEARTAYYNAPTTKANMKLAREKKKKELEDFRAWKSKQAK